MHQNHFHLIRMIAASLVLVSHSYVLCSGDRALEPLRESLGVTFGSIAVDIFFVTSGFLVTMSLFRRADLKAFVVSRALRIYPGLLVALVVTVAITGIFFHNGSFTDFCLERRTWKYLFVNAILVWPRGLEWSIPNTLVGAPFVDTTGTPLNGSLWTLPVELKMYAMLAVGYLVVCRLARWLRPATDSQGFTKRLLLVTALASLCLDLWSAHRGIHADSLHLFTMFFVGAAAWTSGIDWRGKGRLAVVALAAVCLTAWIDRRVFLVVYTLATPFVVLGLAHARAPLLLGFNRLGDYSYGIYIYAFPIQQWSACLWPGIDPLTMTAVAFPVTLLFAIASWFGIEKRALSLKPRVPTP